MNSYYNNIIQEDMHNLFDSNNINYERFNNKNILISGGTGMLASYMVYFLIFLNENVKNFKCNILLIVRNKEKCLKRFGNLIEKKYIQLFFDDINSKILINQKIDFIIHAASIAETQYFSTNPVDVMSANCIGTYNLLELARKNNIESFLLFSTGSIYGKITSTNIITESNCGILDPLDVNSCYSESKRNAEALCMAYYRQYNVPTKIVRIMHTYGPTLELEKDKRVFSSFIKNIINNEDIVLQSDGSAIRTFCYLLDATEAFFKILIDGENGNAYNMCNPSENVSILKLANILVNLFPEKKLKVVYKIQNNNNYNENKFANVQQFSIDKLKKIGWNPRFSIEEGFKRTIESFNKGENI